jgi:hypothetical protein
MTNLGYRKYRRKRFLYKCTVINQRIKEFLQLLLRRQRGSREQSVNGFGKTLHNRTNLHQLFLFPLPEDRIETSEKLTGGPDKKEPGSIRGIPSQNFRCGSNLRCHIPASGQQGSRMCQRTMGTAMTATAVPCSIFLTGEGPGQLQSCGKLPGHGRTGEKNCRRNRFSSHIVPEPESDIFLVKKVFKHL